MATGPLVVPVRVHARTMPFRKNKAFVRWRPDFRGALSSHRPVEPDPFNGFNLNQSRDKGIRLHWQLPDALCHADTTADSRPSLPLVPNRWLVLRYATNADGKKRTTASWMVDSDRLRKTIDDGDAAAARYARPDSSGKLETCWIGEVKSAEGWSEPRPHDSQFLTCVGPGLTAFASFQPYCHNVFSLRDNASGMENEWFAVSYLVVGWYSRAADDILTTTTDPRRLGWRLPPGMTEFPKRSLFVGNALSVIWDPTGQKDVKESMPDPDKVIHGQKAVQVAIGHSASDALTALTGPASTTGSLLTALQHGLIDESDTPATTAHTLHRDWFHRTPARFRWSWQAGTADRQEGPHAIPPVEHLNTLEAALAHAEACLRGAQARLYHLWWLRNLPDSKHPAQVTEKLNADLDPAVTTSLAARVKKLHGDVTELRRRLKTGTEHSIAADLTRHPHGHDYAPTDPVVLIRGARGRRQPAIPPPPKCRASDKLITAFRDKNGTTVTPQLPAGAWKKLPAPGSGQGSPSPTALAGELWLLHEATRLASSQPATHPTRLEELYAKPDQATGTLPDLTDRWTAEPWSPLFVLWKAEVHPLSFPSGSGGTSGSAEGAWALDGDGRLQWTRSKAATSPGPTVHGRSLLTPSVPHILQRQLEHHSHSLTGDAAERLRTEAEEAGTLDLLSQTLHGLNPWIVLSSEDAHATPAGMPPRHYPGTEKLVAGGPRSIPLEQELKDTGRAFRPLCSGQMLLTRLSVVDNFGRSLDLITKNYASDQLARSPHIVPRQPVRDEAANKWVQLTPRLQQPARLRLDYLSATDDRRVIDPVLATTAQPSPVAGWLLVNHLAKSLLVYAPSGEPAGELRTAVKKNGESHIVWRPVPHCADLDPATMPHLHAFVTALRGRPHKALSALVTSIDRISATIAPGPGATARDLSLLLGRPIVLLRARLRGELAGPITVSPQWKHVGTSGDDAYTKAPFTVRLGAAALPSDGLYGYVQGSSYDTVYVTDPRPPQSDGYLSPGPRHDGVKVTFTPRPDPAAPPDPSLDTRVTLLADPFAAVHAFTDVVPAEDIRLPERYVSPFVHSGRAAFRTGPLLATEELLGKLRMPRPAAWQGEWTFVERRDDKTWRDYAISTAGTEAQISDKALDAGRPPARDGFLYLRTPPPS
ncbi:hypothetical protein [Streptomyces lunalinharesii]|uniref:Uncharacterized protein n=1 Tax=Streptomyces lunalinharesii TaxID=333384 RepID=A0ABP6FID3_9ACTN